MQNHPQRAIRFNLLILLAALSLSCSLMQPGSPTATLVNPVSPQEATATTEPLLQAPQATLEVTTPASPGQQEIELRFTDPGTLKECVTHFPFEILGQGNDRSISGSGVIDCTFEIQQCGEGVCVTYHSTYYMDVDIGGFVRESTPSYPDGALEVNLAGTFTMKQYWTDIPPETVMAYTEANPFEVSNSDIIPLFFQFVDGAIEEVGNTGSPDAFPWVFTLHLQ